MQTTRLIGRRWKCGNACRLPILIGRGLDLIKNGLKQVFRSTLSARQSPLDFAGYAPQSPSELGSLAGINSDLIFLCGFEGAASIRFHFPVIMARRSHLFPSRTQKLSLLAPNVLGWKRPGRIGRCRFFQAKNAKEKADTVYNGICLSVFRLS